MSKTNNSQASINFQPLFDYINGQLEAVAKKDDIKYLPTKDDFYTKMDEVMGELKSIREEQTLISHKVVNHDDQLEKINHHLGLNSN